MLMRSCVQSYNVKLAIACLTLVGLGNWDIKHSLASHVLIGNKTIKTMGERTKTNELKYMVTNLSDGEEGSLRWAIQQANQDGVPSTIQFDPTLDGQTIALQSPLEALSENFTSIHGDIDHNGRPNVQIICNYGVDNWDPGIVILSANNEIRGLAVGGFPGCGIWINGSEAVNNRVVSSYIGLDLTGQQAVPNTQHGILVDGAVETTIGGSDPFDRNVISGNGFDNNGAGIAVYYRSVGTVIVGNYIGTDSEGAYAIGNCFGVMATAHGTKIGGDKEGEGNLISGNKHGLNCHRIEDVAGSVPLENLIIQGNQLGIDATGTKVIPSESWAITLDQGHNCLIGGETAAAGNLIVGSRRSPGAGNLGGVSLWNGQNNTIANNLIGTDRSRKLQGGNLYDGISINTETNPVLKDNVIGNHGGFGVHVYKSVNATLSGNIVENNSSSGMSIDYSSGIYSNNRIANNRVNGIIATDCINCLFKSCEIFNHTRDGLLFMRCTNCSVVESNVYGNTRDGVNLGTSNLTKQITISRCSIAANGRSGINKGSTVNEGIIAPVIVTADSASVSGTVQVADGSVVEIFNDPEDEGQTYLGFTTVTNNEFVFHGSIPSEGNLTATVTDLNGNTSMFSAPFPAPQDMPTPTLTPVPNPTPTPTVVTEVNRWWEW